MKQYANIKYSQKPRNYNKNTKKEILQYAVGGLLYMPATRTKIADEIINKKHKEYTSICLDLEDAVGKDSVIEAEYKLKEILEKITKAVKEKTLKINELPLIFIRVRSPQQLEKLNENILTKEHKEMLTGFNFPKFSKENAEDYIKSFEKTIENIKTPLYFMPILESASIMNKETRLSELVYLQRKLSVYSDKILNIRVGATDFCNIYGIRRKKTQNIYQINVVSDCFKDIVNIFGKNYVIAGPVWEFFGKKDDSTWSKGLKKELELDKLNGFIGKTCIHPSQLNYVTESNIVDYEDYQDALNILGMSSGLIGVSKGYNNNKMNEVATHSNWAKKIMSLAQVYGVKQED